MNQGTEKRIRILCEDGAQDEATTVIIEEYGPDILKMLL